MESWLDVIQQIAGIIASASIFIALLGYYYKKRHDKVIAVADQITFFREKIIPKWDEVSRLLKGARPSYLFSRIKMDEQGIEYIREKYSVNYNDQLSVFFDASRPSEIPWDGKVLDPQIYLFNLLEEFALKILNFGTINHQALNSVRAAFVEIVEKNAVAMIFVRDVIVGNPIYFATFSLYKSWKDSVNRSSLVKRLSDNGFITKKQKDEIYKEIKKFRNLHSE